MGMDRAFWDQESLNDQGNWWKIGKDLALREDLPFIMSARNINVMWKAIMKNDTTQALGSWICFAQVLNSQEFTALHKLYKTHIFYNHVFTIGRGYSLTE